MKISIITVCFNSEKTILDTILSVNSQSYKDIEHIIIDGGSKDSTLDLINKHGSRISRVVSEPDEGIYDAMNKGIKFATGDVVAFLNSDDRYAYDSVIQDVINEFKHGDFDCITGDVSFFNEKNPSKVVRRYSSKRFNSKRISWGWMPAQPALFFKKDIYSQVGEFSRNYKIAGDFEFIARAFSSGKVKLRYIPNVLVYMRLGGVSTGGWRSTILLNREVIQACRSNGISTNWLKLLCKYPVKILEYYFTK